MMKKITITLSLLLCLSVLFCNNVFANPAFKNEMNETDDYTIIYSTPEITNTQTLINMAKSGKHRSPLVKEDKNSYFTEKHEEKTVYQLLTKKMYKNGNVENEYVATSLITYNASSENTGGLGNVVAKHKFYFSWYLDGTVSGGQIYIKPQKVSTTIVQKGLESIYFNQMYNVAWEHGAYQLDGSSTIYGPTLNTEYNLNITPQNSIVPQYFPLKFGINVFSGCTVYVNGRSFQVRVSITETGH